MKKIFICLMLLPTIAFCQSFYSQNKSVVITKSCKKDVCYVSYQNSLGKGEILRDIDDEKITINWLKNNSIANIHISCGSYCAGDFYVGEFTKLVTFPNVLLTDEKLECVAFVPEFDKVVFQKIFSDKQTASINPASREYNFMDTATIESVITPIAYSKGIFTAEYLDKSENTQRMVFDTNCK